MITLFEAKHIITMNPGNPFATHIAVRDGIILGVGPIEELDRKSTRLNSSHSQQSRMPSSA